MKKSSEYVLALSFILVVAALLLELSGYTVPAPYEPQPAPRIYKEPTVIKPEAVYENFQAFSGEVVYIGPSELRLKYIDTLEYAYKNVRIIIDSDTIFIFAGQGRRASLTNIKIGDEVVVTPKKLLEDGSVLASNIDIFAE